MASSSLTTRTDGTGFYNQIHGLSQLAVNSYLQGVFDANPKHARLYYKDTHTGSELEGLLDAPRVVFDVDKTLALRAYFQIRFKLVELTFEDDDPQNMNGWIITASAAVSNKGLLSGDATSVIKPGDYSVRTLLSAFSTTTWSAPDLDASICVGVDDQTTSYRKWKENPQNSKAAVKVANVLRRWANLYLDKPFFAFDPNGIYELPSIRPSFVPSKLRLQLFHHRPSSGSTQDKETQSSYLSIVFCEVMNQNAIPVNPKLQLEANVAFPGSGIDTRTLGSYVLDHRTFLEGHILPRLSGLCATCRVIPLIPQQSTPSPNQHLLTSRCCVGGDPGVQSDTKLEEQVKANAGYDFKYTGPRRYEWSREFTAPGNETQVFCYDGDLTGRIYRKYVISVRSSVVVTWETNADSLQFAALVEYKHWDGWRKDDANFPCSRTGDSISRSFTKSISWSVTVRLCASQLSHVPNGVIVPTVQGVSADTGLPYDYKEHCTDESLGSLTVSFTQALKDQLREVSGKLASTGAFIYPGAGQLDYGPPQLNELGDVVTTLNWLSYNEPRRMDYPQTVPLPPNTSQGRVCDLQVLLADRHSPLLNWNLMTWEYNEKWMKKISLLLFTWVTTERKVLGLTAKIGLPGPRAYINNLQITDGPWNYSDGLWTWTVSGGSGALIARNNGHIPNDGYTIPRDTMGLLLDVSGNVLGDLPLVVQVEEKWYCKDHAGNHLGLYATAFFSAKLDESATSAEKIDGEPISWVQAEDMIGRKISITE